MISTVYSERIQVYSAYYDDRLMTYTVIYWCEWNSDLWRTRFPYQLLCLLFDETMEKSEFVKAIQTTRYTLHCKPPTSFVAKYVVMVKNETRTVEQLRFHIVPIVNTSQSAREKKGDLAVCINIIAHYNDEYLMPSQSVETYLLQGASKIYFYYRYSLPSIRKLLDFYNRVGKVTLIPWRGGELCKLNVDHCQLAMTQDCVYRLRYEYEAGIVGDHDELIWTPNRTLVEYIRENFKNPRIGATIFRQRFLPRTQLEPEWSVTQGRIQSFYQENLPFTKYRNISAPAWLGYGSKYIFRPTAVQKLWVHYVNKYINGSDHYSYDVPPDEAYVMHYRNWTEYRPTSKQDVYKFGNFSIDYRNEFSQKFETQLVNNVFQTFSQLTDLWYDLHDEAEFWDFYETFQCVKQCVINQLH